jgi:hypothetical protein
MNQQLAMNEVPTREEIKTMLEESGENQFDIDKEMRKLVKRLTLSLAISIKDAVNNDKSRFASAEQNVTYFKNAEPTPLSNEQIKELITSHPTWWEFVEDLKKEKGIVFSEPTYGARANPDYGYPGFEETISGYREGELKIKINIQIK